MIKYISQESDEQGCTDFLLEGPGYSLYPVVRAAYARYGERFKTTDLRTLERLMFAHPKRMLSIQCRFLFASDAIMFKLSLPTD